MAFRDIDGFHPRDIGGRYYVLVAQDQSVRVQENKIAEHVVHHGESEDKEEQQIERAAGSATHDTLLAWNIVGTQSLLERLHGYFRTRCTLLGAKVSR